jgi:hypothetical protein
MAWTDILITILVLILLFFLAYSAIRNQGIGDTIEELKEVFTGGVDAASDVVKYQ